jgi:hypothetical protein
MRPDRMHRIPQSRILIMVTLLLAALVSMILT